MVCNCDNNERVVKVVKSEGVNLPIYETEGAACVDLKAAISETIVLEPGKRVLIPSGLRIEIPAGFELMLRPKSGLALKKGITVLNTPSCIDEDYRGEVGIILINHGEETHVIEPGDKVAQASLNKVYKIKWEEVTELAPTKRGEGGFGSTGK